MRSHRRTALLWCATLLGLFGFALAAGCGSDGGKPDGATTLDASVGDLAAGDLAAGDLGHDPSDGGGPVGPVDGGSGDGGTPVARYTDLVDPFIGTAGTKSINCFPGAVLPWGMVAASPDTTVSTGTPASGTHASGYLSEDDLIQGFSHTRLQGTSTPDIGVVLLMPAVGAAASLITEAGYRSTYDKTTEQASPGYYAVTLTKPNVRAEMTATRRGAHHRYTFVSAPAGGVGQVVLDLGHAMIGTSIIDGSLTVNGNLLEGYTVPSGRFSGPSAGGLKTYFSIELDPAPTAVATWTGSTVDATTTSRSGTKIGAVASFAAAAGTQIHARVGISYVDVAGARGNRVAELGSLDFDAERQRASDAWQAQLSAVRFEGGSAAERTIMATALYHSMVVPSLVTDVDGRYHGYDNATHTASFDYHTNFSMWDTYRTVHPLLDLVRPAQQSNLSRSLIQMAREGGYFPRWPMGHGYPNITAGSPADIVVAESYLRGVGGFDGAEALDLMLKEVDSPPPAGSPHSGREGLADYLAKGYVPVGTPSPGVGQRVVVRTLEYNVADAAISALATAVGRSADATRSHGWSQSYHTLWDASTTVFRGKNSDGSWTTPFNPLTDDEGLYYGANGLQYSWLVPQDMLGLQALHGSADAMTTHLTTFFTQAEVALAANQASQYYIQGNEPDIHSMYLFLAAGHPELAQKWIDWASTSFYSTAHDGLPGNEDAGALSAWYVLSSLGLYPVTATNVWLIGRPIFPRVELAVAQGTLVVEAPAASPSNIYVQNVTWNGAALAHPWITQDQIAKGGTLHFEMGAQPGSWGTTFGSF
jgi:predicted alpha-1,2-mannosidase